MPMRVIAKKRCRAMVEPPEKGERATLNPNLSTRLKPTFFPIRGPWAAGWLLLVEEASGAASLPPQCRSGDGLADCRGRHRIGRLRGTSAKRVGVGRNSAAYCAGFALAADYASLIRPTGWITQTARHRSRRASPECRG